MCQFAYHIAPTPGKTNGNLDEPPPDRLNRSVERCRNATCSMRHVDSQSFHSGTFGNYHCAKPSEPTTAHSSQPTTTCSDLRSRRIASIISTLTCAVQRKQNAKPHPSIRAAHTRTRLNRVAPCATRDTVHISYRRTVGKWKTPCGTMPRRTLAAKSSITASHRAAAANCPHAL